MTLSAVIGTIYLGGAALTNGADVVCSESLAVAEREPELARRHIGDAGWSVTFAPL